MGRNRKRPHSLWVKFCNIGTQTFPPPCHTGTSPLHYSTWRRFNSSGITVVSSITATLLTCLQPELCLWFSGVWFVFPTCLHFLFNSSCRATFCAGTTKMIWSFQAVGWECSHLWLNAGLQFSSHTQLDNHCRICAARRHRYSRAHRRTPLLKRFIYLPNGGREHLLRATVHTTSVAVAGSVAAYPQGQ